MEIRKISSPGAFAARLAALAAAALAVLLAPSAALAQDADFDPFAAGAFEAAAASLASAEPGTADAPAEVARAEYLVGGTVVARADATLAGSGYGADPSLGALEAWLGTASFSGKVFAKASIPDYGALYVAYSLSHAYFQGAGGGGVAPTAQDPYLPRYALSELHYSFDVGKALFFRLGNQLVSWGPARIWSPVDFINLERRDAFSSLDARAGKPGLRLHVPLPRANFFAFADFGSLVSGLSFGDPFERANLGGRYDFTAGSFEFGLSAYGGAESQARFGADASGRLAGSTVYAEAMAAPAYDGFEAYAQIALGASRSLGELKDWSVSAEGFYNSRGRDLSGYSAATIMSLPADERAALYQGAWYAYSALSADQPLGLDLNSTISCLANLSDRSYQARLQLAFSPPRTPPFAASLSYSGGGKDKEFTRYAGDGSIAASLSARIEF